MTIPNSKGGDSYSAQLCTRYPARNDKFDETMCCCPPQQSRSEEILPKRGRGQRRRHTNINPDIPIFVLFYFPKVRSCCRTPQRLCVSVVFGGRGGGGRMRWDFGIQIMRTQSSQPQVFLGCFFEFQKPGAEKRKSQAREGEKGQDQISQNKSPPEAESWGSLKKGDGRGDQGGDKRRGKIISIRFAFIKHSSLDSPFVRD